MKAIILAAGQGKRLRRLTQTKPKCMVSYRGRPLIMHILDTLKGSGIHDIAVVTGFKEAVLKKYLKKEKLKFYTNDFFAKSNMVHSLFCAKKEFDDDLIISYSDIVYSQYILKKLLESKDEISVTVDLDWKKLWMLRMDDPLSDAETMKIDKKGTIQELGKKPKSYREIEGQYMGLLKIRKSALSKITQFYTHLDKDVLYDGKSFKNISMTTFLQLIIDNLMSVKAVSISGGWIEVDTPEDLKQYNKSFPL